MPGYGRSWQAPPELDISVAAQAKHLLAWLDQIGVERTVLVGHDDPGRARQATDVHWAAMTTAKAPRRSCDRCARCAPPTQKVLAPALQRLDLPAAVVWGAGDRFQKLHYGRRLAEDLHASIDEIEGARHFMPEDHPNRIADAVATVLHAAG